VYTVEVVYWVLELLEDELTLETTPLALEVLDATLELDEGEAELLLVGLAEAEEVDDME